MTSVVAIILCAVFLLLGLWHFHMAFARGVGEGAAVPSVDGKPLFVPSTTATVAVGVLLLLCAVLVAGTSRLLSFGLPPRALSWLSYALGLALFARAVGEFKYVGFFKRVRGSRFVSGPFCWRRFCGDQQCRIIAEPTQARVEAPCSAEEPWHTTKVSLSA